MRLLDSLGQRDCPVCGATPEAGTAFLDRSIDESRLTSLSFASRKEPEFMSYRLIRCGGCTTVYAAEVPSASALADLYRGAGYISADEARLAARAYGRALAPFLGRLEARRAALDIGAGNGAFLPVLQGFGFADVAGAEASPSAIAAAGAEIGHLIRQGPFQAEAFTPGSLSLVSCFQTLEHVADPAGLVRSVRNLLEPRGMLALVNHDYSAFLNRMLGARSPIIDVEHLQLFTPTSLRYLLVNAGYDVVAIRSFPNVYPVRYWLRLLPLPAGVKRPLLQAISAVGLGKFALWMNVGNILTVAIRRS